MYFAEKNNLENHKVLLKDPEWSIKGPRPAWTLWGSAFVSLESLVVFSRSPCSLTNSTNLSICQSISQ